MSHGLDGPMLPVVLEKHMGGDAPHFLASFQCWGILLWVSLRVRGGCTTIAKNASHLLFLGGLAPQRQGPNLS